MKIKVAKPTVCKLSELKTHSFYILEEDFATSDHPLVYFYCLNDRCSITFPVWNPDEQVFDQDPDIRVIGVNLTGADFVPWHS